jgi:dTDP-4-dehydrorhamnose 3,5-epimerase
MTLNIVVPVGSIRFVMYDSREKSSTYGEFQEVVLSRKNYCRLTIPPKIWVGFQGAGKGTNLLLNMANIPHDDNEVDHVSLENFDYNWDV